jgi:glycine dehydrogenase subunit 1
MTMNKYHPYIPNSEEEVEAVLLRSLGLTEVGELFRDVPSSVRLKRPLKIPESSSELEVERRIEEVLNENLSIKDLPVFLGGGFWPHYVPAAVEEVINRSEFLTSYTPYQPEISQGVLQALFEFQSMVAQLTGMKYSNCSMYDFSSALGEAARMAARVTGRLKILIPEFISPLRERVLKTYIEPAGMRVVKYPQENSTGQIDVEALEKLCDDKVAAVYLENPSYLGFVEEGVEPVVETTHSVGATLIVGVDPLSLGILRPPGDYGADIVVAEGQPLGLGLNYGGPGLGIMACRDPSLLRQMPGRIVGMTQTVEGDRPAFCLALQSREQHIKRERATSNICTNNALYAIAAAVYLSLLGSDGLAELGKTIAAKSRYAMEGLSSISKVEVPVFQAFHFKEFVVRIHAPIRVEDVNKRLLKHGVYGGLPLGSEFPNLGNAALLCVTEVHSKEDIDRLVDAIRLEVG